MQTIKFHCPSLAKQRETRSCGKDSDPLPVRDQTTANRLESSMIINPYRSRPLCCASSISKSGMDLYYNQAALLSNRVHFELNSRLHTSEKLGRRPKIPSAISSLSIIFLLAPQTFMRSIPSASSRDSKPSLSLCRNIFGMSVHASSPFHGTSVSSSPR